VRIDKHGCILDARRAGAYVLSAAERALEPVYDLLRFGDTALKTSSECSFTTCKLRFLSRFFLVSL
jgi:hypothetical protein